MKRARTGFTLIELLVVVGISAILLAILLPALGKVRAHARSVLSMTNQRDIAQAVTLYATESKDRYPQSVATIGMGNYWNWQEPMVLIGPMARSPRLHRSMSAYLNRYIQDAGMMSCPNAPSQFKYLQESWNAGDFWNNPESPSVVDQLSGTYCFYWNYIGFLDERPDPFRGPRSLCGGPEQSDLLVSDYFGFDHWQNPYSYSSCEKFEKADIIPETWISSSYWSRSNRNANVNLNDLTIQFHAGYIDGHIETYSASEVAVMKVSKTADGSVPYEPGIGPGDIYLPRNSLY